MPDCTSQDVVNVEDVQVHTGDTLLDLGDGSQAGASGASSPSTAVLIAERRPGCGSVEFAFTKYPVRGRTLHSLATVNRSGKTDHEVTIDVKLPRRRLESSVEGLIVRLRAAASRASRASASPITRLSARAGRLAQVTPRGQNAPA
jgi:hypothetical protein